MLNVKSSSRFGFQLFVVFRSVSHLIFVFIYILIFNLVLVVVLNTISLFAVGDTLVQELGHKEDDLDTANDGEPRKESHGASNETQLGLGLDLLVSLDVVKGCRVEIDPDKSEVWSNWNLNS